MGYPEREMTMAYSGRPSVEKTKEAAEMAPINLNSPSRADEAVESASIILRAWMSGVEPVADDLKYLKR
jgi:hypothetical protein